MATVNKRTGRLYANVINGVDAGGIMTAALQEGYDNVMQSSPDGLTLPIVDREIQVCRGSIVSQDWVEFVNLLTGTVGTCAFSERNRDVAAATGYTDHVITNPVIHRAVLSFVKGQYATVAYNFECKAADETKGFTDMHTATDGQPAPDYVSAARGGYRVETIKHDPSGGSEIQFYHVSAFQFSLILPLIRRCNDADVGYTLVEAETDGMIAAGSVTFEDNSETGTALLYQQLLGQAHKNLELQLTQGQGATDKVVTIANVLFNDARPALGAGNPVNAVTANFVLNNVAGTPLTLDGANKIITIANAA